MNANKFNDDFEIYKSNLSQRLEESQVYLMLHAYCMGYCELSNHLNEDFNALVDLNPVLDKIAKLNPLVNKFFK